MSVPRAHGVARSSDIATRLSRRLHAQHSSCQLEALLDELAGADPELPADAGTNDELLRRFVDHYITNLAIAINEPLHRLASAFVPPLLGAAFGGAFEKRVQLLGHHSELASLCKQGTVVLACTHSSNLDGFVLGAALARRKLPGFVYPAGKHLYRNPRVGRLLTKLGTYQLDRSLSATLYKALVVEYSALLIEDGYHSVVFASGTRSRTNMVESRIKLGLLGSVLRAHRYQREHTTGSRPIYVVPVAINHLVVPEAGHLIRYALAGRAGERIVGDELSRQGSLWSTAKRVAKFRQDVSLCFGEALTPWGSLAGASTPKGPDDTLSDAEHTRRLGAEILRSFKRGTRFNSTQIVARVLYDLLARRVSGDSQEAILAASQALLSIDAPLVANQIDETRNRIMAQSEGGSVAKSAVELSAMELLRHASATWHRCHHGGVVQVDGDQVRLVNLPLVLYYRNRSAHL